MKYPVYRATQYQADVGLRAQGLREVIHIAGTIRTFSRTLNTLRLAS